MFKSRKNDESKKIILPEGVEEQMQILRRKRNSILIKNLSYSILMFAIGVIIPVIINLFSETLITNIPQQTLTFIITVISIIAFIAFLVSTLINYRKKRQMQEKIAVGMIKHLHKDLFTSIENNATLLLRGGQTDA